jgi:hypothetical protein
MKPTWKHGVGLGVVISAIIIVFLIVKQDTVAPVIVESPSIQPEPTPELPKVIELPFGGTNLMPTYRFVALYGSPAFRSLGSLGEQDLEQSVARVKDLALQYQPLSEETVIPTFEIITTVASAGLTENNDYSQELDPVTIKPWIDRAKEQGIYIVLDLQPGRTSFLNQVKQYEVLLLEPHVGLAVDPEWRLQTEKDRHLVRTGSVTADELNQTSTWLADLVAENKLPQKLFIIHQFKQSMVTNREMLDTSRQELAYSIHVDGFGRLSSKTDTWNNIKTGLPANIYMSWKNFFDEDKPTPTPLETMSQDPKPWFVSYQ